MHWTGQLRWSQVDRAGHESPGEDCGWPHQTGGLNRRYPVWLCPRKRHNRCNLCHQAASRKVSSCPNKRYYMAFVDLKETFDRMPWMVIWWALRKLSVDEWIVRLVQGMYANAQSWVRVGEGLRESWCSPRLCSQPAAFLHCAWSLVTRVLLWGPGRIAQSVGHLTRKSGVLGLIPGLATYFLLSFRFFKKGSCQLLAKVCARSTG